MADAELFGRYRDAMDSMTEIVKREVLKILEETSGLGPARAYAYVLRNYPKLVRAYGRVAAEVAREYYQQERDESELDQDYTATAYGDGQQEWYEQDVNEAYQKVKTGYEHHLATPDMLPDKAIQRTLDQADFTLSANAHADPAHPSWAVVPHPGACGFCIMLGANGFAYHSRGSALAQRHLHCRCTVAMDFSDQPELEGYDPSSYYDVYYKARKNVIGGVDDAWNALSDSERASYKRKGRSAKDTFRTKMITAEIDRITGHVSK